jgi:hypothetical protein
VVPSEYLEVFVTGRRTPTESGSGPRSQGPPDHRLPYRTRRFITCTDTNSRGR